MKPSQNPQRPRRTRREQGIALVTVLAILTLTAVMVMAFFTISRSELTSSTVYARGQEAAQLSKTAVDMVIHQIRAATERGGVAWASQPGMIRTWGGAGASADLCYKLYSDETMVLPDESTAFDDAQELRQWQNDVRYVDLNEPVIRTYGQQNQVFFPIADPRAAEDGDPKRRVEGFSWNRAAVGIAGGQARPALPMPVKWIYQLQDGTLGTLVGRGRSGMFKALSGSAMPTAANPIVARFAFWADDETAKLNVNTAAGGLAWDTPRAGGTSDRKYGRFQPLANEFQRYPGHPATTWLSPVLLPNMSYPGSGTYDVNAVELVYDLVPRLGPGGSLGGTRAARSGMGGAFDELVLDKDRLFATIDEFIFRAPGLGSTGSVQTTGPGFRRAEQPSLSRYGALDPELLGRLQFFLTANSKAPEVTIFNTPRISVWPSYYGNPESTDRDRFTSYDRRLRFCAEVGSLEETADSDVKNWSKAAPYHFQRRNSASRTEDYQGIGRNRELYAYLQRMMSTEIPGIDSTDGVQSYGSFEGKYGRDNRDQIITGIFDYIRSVNLFDDLLMREHGHGKWQAKGEAEPRFGYSAFTAFASDHKSYTNGRVISEYTSHLGVPVKGADSHTGHGQVAPIEIGKTKGFGRFLSIHEVGIAVIACAQANEVGGNPEPGGVSRKNFAPDGSRSPSHVWSLDPGVQVFQGMPAWDLSNVPPLSDISPAKVLEVYAPTNVDTGEALSAADLIGPDKDMVTVRQSEPRMTAGQFYEYVTNVDNWNRTLDQNTPLRRDETRVQAILLVALFCPSKGWTMINPDFRLKIDVTDDFTLGGQPLGLNRSGEIWSPHSPYRHIAGMRDQGGVLEPRALLVGQGEDPGSPNRRYQLLPRYASYTGPPLALVPPLGDNPDRPGAHNTDGWTRRRQGGYNERNSFPVRPVDSVGQGREEALSYPWISRPVTVSGSTIPMAGGQVLIRLYPDGGWGSDGQRENTGDADFSQEVSLAFAPVPQLPLPVLAGARAGSRVEVEEDVYHIVGHENSVKGTEWRAGDSWCLHRDGAFTVRDRQPGRGRMADVMGNTELISELDVTRSYVIPHGDDRIVYPKRSLDVGLQWNDYSSDLVPHRNYLESGVRIASNFTTGDANRGYGRPDNPGAQFMFTRNSNAPVARRPQLPDNFDYGQEQWGDWDNSSAAELDGAYINKPDEGNAMGVAFDDFTPRHQRATYATGSWIPYFTEADIQETAGPALWSPNRIVPGPGMFGSLPTGVFTNPNRSGSGSQPWQTLLFRRVAGSQSDKGRSYKSGNVHPGWEHPRDHYLLDFFWMPVVQPYSISEPLATAGKVNMNVAIQPFSYIRRDSALRGVFRSEEMLTVPNQLGVEYKVGNSYGQRYDFKRRPNNSGELLNTSLRSWINVEETLKQFSAVSNPPNLGGKGQIFRTASQICEQWLVPFPIEGNIFRGRTITLENVAQLYDPDNTSLTAPGYPTYPGKFPKSTSIALGLVGDNSRERPYTNLVSRLTTKSNTFTVHYRAQIVRQAPLSPDVPGQRRTDGEYGRFDSSVDLMVGEFRGSSVIERYIDPTDKDIPDFAALAAKGQLNLLNPNLDTLDKFYRFRTVSEKRFAP